MDPPPVRIDHVTHRFGRREALSDVSFEVRSGEAVGYLGPNGSGKSTTLKLLTGLLRPTTGSVALFGQDPGDSSGASRRSLGALVETPVLPSFLTGRDLLRYVAATKGISRERRDAAVVRAAARTGVGGRLSSSLSSLSSGLHRRLLLAATLVGEPAVLLLDEPTTGLDPAARADLRALLRELRRDGRTLLLSTHLLEDVSATCDRVLFLRQGHLVGDEAVDLAAGGPGAGLVRIRFLTPVVREVLITVLQDDEGIVSLSGVDATLRLPGGEPAQAALLQRLVGAGLRPASLERAAPGLEQRYLATVGREEDA